jgi:hypothetical protein
MNELLPWLRIGLVVFPRLAYSTAYSPGQRMDLISSRNPRAAFRESVGFWRFQTRGGSGVFIGSIGKDNRNC